MANNSNCNKIKLIVRYRTRRFYDCSCKHHCSSIILITIHRGLVWLWVVGGLGRCRVLRSSIGLRRWFPDEWIVRAFSDEFSPHTHTHTCCSTNRNPNYTKYARRSIKKKIINNIYMALFKHFKKRLRCLGLLVL